MKQLICGSLNLMRIIYTHCRSHTYPGQGCRFPRRRSSWELEFRDCGAIPGPGLLLIVEGQIKGMWGRRSWWGMPVEESQRAMVARRYCWVMHRGWSHHHSLSLPTRPCQQLNNREVGPLSAWCTELQSRTPARGPETPNNRLGPQVRLPLSAWTGGAMEKDR